MKFIFNDGGRAKAGFKGNAGDCVVRAIAIATEQPYEQVYRAMAEINAAHRGRASCARKRSARNGVVVKSAAFKRYMDSIGWTFVPLMRIGSGCTVHLEDGELPMGRLIVSVSRHYCAVVDGVINDTHDPSAERGATIYPPGYPQDKIPKGARWLENGNGWAYEPKRCVYGYWRKSVPWDQGDRLQPDVPANQLPHWKPPTD